MLNENLLTKLKMILQGKEIKPTLQYANIIIAFNRAAMLLSSTKKTILTSMSFRL